MHYGLLRTQLPKQNGVIVDGEKMKILERYASAVNSGNLASDPKTTWSDADVVAAAGLAARHRPLGIALTRFLAGGDPRDLIRLLADMVFDKNAEPSKSKSRIRISKVQATDLATSVLSWYRYGNCQPCAGRGLQVILNTPLLGDECKHCAGTGRLIFERQFKDEFLGMAMWLSGQIDAAQPAAGQAVMAMIAPKLDF